MDQLAASSVSKEFTINSGKGVDTVVTSLTNLSPYLKQFIIQQRPELYSAIDHAVWRFIMRISQDFLQTRAHPRYLKGLEATAIPTDRIPSVHEMDVAMQKFGWRAVAISGFIPPAAFIEFNSLGILPIACDMRQLDNVAYTPAPDIVHEAAGHAPLIMDSDYGEFLKSYGETARKAIYSAEDMRVYEAIRHLSVVKEDPTSSKEDRVQAEKELENAEASVDWVSEAAQLSRLYWWTTEYGMMGTLDRPLIYGAGLLSSVGESFDCFDPQVKKIPFTLSCIQQNYDITRPQPQLFVAPDFEALSRAVSQFRDQMAFQRGGVFGLQKALKSRATVTGELDSGLQISGILDRFDGTPSKENVEYLQFKGPVQLAFQDQELEGHGVAQHREGFGTPVGKLANLGKSPADLTQAEKAHLGIVPQKKCILKFESGVTVEGVFDSDVMRGIKTLILSFKTCRVTSGTGKVLFDPAWGTFDMGCGTSVKSVFGGPAHRTKYFQDTALVTQKPREHQSNLTEEQKPLNALYQKVRDHRNKRGNIKDLIQIYTGLKQFANDWLLRLEILEILTLENAEPKLQKEIQETLEDLNQKGRIPKNLLARGLALLR